MILKHYYNFSWLFSKIETEFHYLFKSEEASWMCSEMKVSVMTHLHMDDPESPLTYSVGF